MLLSRRDEYSCYGAISNGDLVDRHYKGSLDVKEVSPFVKIITALSPDGLLFEDGVAQLKSFRRDWIVIGEHNPLLLVVTRAHVPSAKCYLAFVCPWGVDVGLEGCNGQLASGEGEIESLVAPTAFKKVAKTDHCQAERVVEDWEGQERILSVVKLDSFSGFHCHYMKGIDVNTIYVEGNGRNAKILIPDTGGIMVTESF
ncbi:hypothetical protein GCM10007071_24720 [Marinobacter zhanjiangensis]|uniref:Uncharacterized protein n=2 Tax=Marinobacter zhanjiangensis TaxID=578215 RepID=A0ABQ3B6H5_9GAMM|nr:hypothetical protein GCM10007071_24720 [Marinobacter zhanjiangensis]